MNFLYVLIFVAGSGASSSASSFSQGFYTEATCIVARDKMKKKVPYYQYLECEKL